MALRSGFYIAFMIGLAGALATAGASTAFAANSLVPVFADWSPKGPGASRGVVIYSHGRSLVGEDSTSPAPAYLRSLAKAGWDVLRFNRPSSEDTLPNSAADLARKAESLKSKGYSRVILTGQSFGAFLSIIASSQTESVDGVIATSPAAFGSFSDSFGTWRLNATRLYAELSKLRRGRVLLAFFHGDDYDPGGRGEQSETILTRNGIDAVIIDQPPEFIGHLAAATPRFAARFGDCLEDFAEGKGDYRSCGKGRAASFRKRSPEAGVRPGTPSTSADSAGNSLNR